IYLVMVAQFQSLKSPFIIMFTIPLAFTGGIGAMLIAGLPMSVMSMMGLIVLVGVVVNNGIVFVDYCNQLVKKGVDKKTALIRTGMDRLRPILMTALTTIVALIIMAADGRESAAMLRPLAVTAIGGMVFSTFLTLFVVPVVYDLMNRKIRRTARDEAIEKVDALSDGDDGLEDWDESNATFVRNLLSTPTRSPKPTVDPSEVASDADPQEDTPESVEVEDGTAEATVLSEKGERRGPETKESRPQNAILQEIKRRRKELFPEEDE
ncbi:MAG: efflux RND transporter permease subunit, partial [Clostridia bacterium]|nr:efflux RND transporter permease subunit [Clostridia bacterium]